MEKLRTFFYNKNMNLKWPRTLRLPRQPLKCTNGTTNGDNYIPWKEKLIERLLKD